MPIFATADEAAQAAANLFVEAAREAIEARGRFTVALSGGSTPRKMHALLASSPLIDQVRWSEVYVFFGDERYVDPTDPQSNELMARETLLSLVPIPAENIYAPYHPGGPDIAAKLYEETLRRFFTEEPPVLDLIYLGMGPDGHTASLFPGEPGVYELERLVIDARAPVNASERITMTPPLLNAARRVVFLVTGADKAPAVHRCIEAPENFDETPSQAIARYAQVTWLLDKAASADLKITDGL